MITHPVILVTGSTGQLGNEIRVLAPLFPGFHFIFLPREELAIDNKEAVDNAFARYRPQFCINCAAYTAVDKAESEKELAWRINAEATGYLAGAGHAHQCRFIHISTDYVFDGNGTKPYRETDPVNPAGVYGASKLEGERLAQQHNPESIIIRTSWVYSVFGKNFVKTMLKLMHDRPAISVVNDQVGSPTYAADLAAAIMQVIIHIHEHGDAGAGGIYHFSNEGIISWYDFAVAIKELSGSNCIIHPIPSAQYPTPAKRPAYSVLDKTKIRDTFGIIPREWKPALRECFTRLTGNL